MANKNVSLESLKEHLFETLEGVKNLSDKEADDCEKVSIDQAKQIVNIAGSIIDIYKTQLNAFQTFSKMDNVASQGKLMVGMGICTDDEARMLGQ